jgi:hypothetical protein
LRGFKNMWIRSLQKRANCSACWQSARVSACRRRLFDVDQEPAAGLHAWVYFLDPELEFFSVPMAEMIVGFDHRAFRAAIGAVAGSSLSLTRIENRIGKVRFRAKRKHLGSVISLTYSKLIALLLPTRHWLSVSSASTKHSENRGETS